MLDEINELQPDIIRFYDQYYDSHSSKTIWTGYTDRYIVTVQSIVNRAVS